jgi:hypothetical protein
VLADDELQCGPLQVFLVKIHCDTGLTGIGAASIIVSSEIAEFEELDGDLVEGFEVADGAVRVPTGAGSASADGLRFPALDARCAHRLTFFRLS